MPASSAFYPGVKLSGSIDQLGLWQYEDLLIFSKHIQTQSAVLALPVPIHPPTCIPDSNHNLDKA